MHRTTPLKREPGWLWTGVAAGWAAMGWVATGWAAMDWGGRGLGGRGQHFSRSNVPVSLHSLWRLLTGALQTVGQGPHL